MTDTEKFKINHYPLSIDEFETPIKLRNKHHLIELFSPQRYLFDGRVIYYLLDRENNILEMHTNTKKFLRRHITIFQKNPDMAMHYIGKKMIPFEMPVFEWRPGSYVHTDRAYKANLAKKAKAQEQAENPK